MGAIKIGKKLGPNKKNCHYICDDANNIMIKNV